MNVLSQLEIACEQLRLLHGVEGEASEVHI